MTEQPKTNWRVLIALFFAVLIDMLGIGIVIVVMAPYIKETEGLFALGTSQNAKNWVYLSLIALFGLAQFFGAPMLGGLSDRYGRKKIVIGSMVGGAAGYLVFSVGVLLFSCFPHSPEKVS